MRHRPRPSPPTRRTLAMAKSSINTDYIPFEENCVIGCADGHGYLTILGTYDSVDDACAAGTKWAAETGDDCWQACYLENPHAPPQVIAPPPSAEHTIGEEDYNCIVCVSDESYVILGPFASHDDMKAAGLAWEEENGDELRWCPVRLSDPYAAPRVISPVS